MNLRLTPSLPVETRENPPSGAAAKPLDVSIRPARIARFLLLAAAALVALSTISRVGMLFIDGDAYGGVREIAYRFDLDRENTLPAWYSSSLLLFCAGILGWIALAARRLGDWDHWRWLLLTLAFVYISIDESASLHEILIVPLRRRLDLHGVFYFAWVLPGAVAVGLFALAYLPFLLRLPRRTGRLFVLAAGFYVGGALGMELLGGVLAESGGFQSLPYIAVSTIEETGEMAGVIIFAYALLDYLAGLQRRWEVNFAA